MDEIPAMDGADHYLSAFNENINLQYQLLNGLFITLPFKDLPEVGVKLPLFAEICHKQLHQHQTPRHIVEYFFKEIVHLDSFEQQTNFLFLVLQFVERQVVLFDALEQASFNDIHDITGKGTLPNLLRKLNNKPLKDKLQQILQHYHTRIVLTAHPTQFYPPQVLGIIHDLTEAIRTHKVPHIRDILLQLGKTSFKNKQQPTPFEEASILIHKLEYVFYPVVKTIYDVLATALKPENNDYSPLANIVQLGFWPGGDRDGNPAVTAITTIAVANKLKSKLLKLYIEDIKLLRRRITFGTIWQDLRTIQNKLHATRYQSDIAYTEVQQFTADLLAIRKIIIEQHQGLFVAQVDKLLGAINCFGFYFASIDIRQNSTVHSEVIAKLLIDKQLHVDYLISSPCQKMQVLERLLNEPALIMSETELHNDRVLTDAIASWKAIQSIQSNNGEQAANRYIISNTAQAYHVLEVMLLAYWSGLNWQQLRVDIVPLFETVEDLIHADSVMQTLYEHPMYQIHLSQRNCQQTIMLGFSDSTKDGGYITANWNIYLCKQRLLAQATARAIKVTFFDGRGGPPARGGGHTHKFYRAMENHHHILPIELTIQGQTISSNYGTLQSALYNVSQLFTAGIESHLLQEHAVTISEKETELLQQLSDISHQCYQQLKQHPLFISYLETITPLQYYGKLNIASRPPKRTQKNQMSLHDLRAIPFVGAWSQMKQNVPAYYGVGSALQHLCHQGQSQALQDLYQQSLFFKTLLDNTMQSLKKSDFKLTAYLGDDPVYGSFWHLLADEAELTKKMLLLISNQHELLADEPIAAHSIAMREQIVLPLLVIQQYSLHYLRQEHSLTPHHLQLFEKLILKSLAANINASRNSA